jgi:hypothetical protein
MLGRENGTVISLNRRKHGNIKKNAWKCDARDLQNI